MNAPKKTSACAAAAAALFLGPLLLASCMSRQGITRGLRPSAAAGTVTTERGAALVRSVYCDIQAEHVSEAKWARLLSCGAFSRGRVLPVRRRFPPLTVFMVTLASTVNAPLVLKNAQVRYGGTVKDAMTPARLAAATRSPAYAGTDAEAVLTPRRIMREEDASGPVDCGRDTIEMRLDFVPPRDTVMQVLAFEKIPYGARMITLSLTISALGGEKAFSIDFEPFEYRSGSDDIETGRAGGRGDYGE